MNWYNTEWGERIYQYQCVSKISNQYVVETASLGPPVAKPLVEYILI